MRQARITSAGSVRASVPELAAVTWRRGAWHRRGGVLGPLAVALAVLLLAPLGCGSTEEMPLPVVVPPLGAEVVSVPAEDGFPLAGTLMRDRTSTRGVICLHGFDDNRTSFDPLLQALSEHGFNTISLDLRGNHASLGRPDEQAEARERYLARDESWFRGMVQDVQAAKQYLIETCGCDPARIAVVGAGVGATIAVLAAAHDRELAALALLSPGWRTLGIDVRDEFAELPPRPTLLTYLPEAAGQAESVTLLRQGLASSATLTLHPIRASYRQGHGTRALRHEATLPSTLAAYLLKAMP